MLEILEAANLAFDIAARTLVLSVQDQLLQGSRHGIGDLPGHDLESALLELELVGLRLQALNPVNKARARAVAD